MMPVTYEQDEQARLVRATLKGPYSNQALQALIDRLRSEGAWAYGVILDIRALSTPPTMEDVKVIAAYMAAVSPDEPRGPLALLARDGEQYRRACAYVALGGRAGRQMDVFRDPDDAERWLAELR